MRECLLERLFVITNYSRRFIRKKHGFELKSFAICDRLAEVANRLTMRTRHQKCDYVRKVQGDLLNGIQSRRASDRTCSFWLMRNGRTGGMWRLQRWTKRRYQFRHIHYGFHDSRLNPHH